MVDNFGETALMKAAPYGFIDCVKFLKLEIGIQSNEGLTALMFAAKSNKVDCVLELKEEIRM